MKLLIILALASVACAKSFDSIVAETTTAYGYNLRYGIPLAEEIRKAEEQGSQRIIGGSPAAIGEFPYQAGLLSSFEGITGMGVCGASLVTPSRLITAAHCWDDGQVVAWMLTVVLGSNTLFTGGTRVQTSAVVVHPNWIPILVRNDVAVIYLPTPVTLSNLISLIALPSGNELFQDYVGQTGVASGFGLTSDGGSISTNQVLSGVRLNIISNSVCRFAFPLNLVASNLCVSTVGGTTTCRGDSGGPLVVPSNNRSILVGITSFGSGLGCEAGLPAVFARVTSFMDFFNLHL